MPKKKDLIKKKKTRSCISDKVRQGFKKRFIGGCHKLSTRLKAPAVDNLPRHSYTCEKDWLSAAETQAQGCVFAVTRGDKLKSRPTNAVKTIPQLHASVFFLRLQANRAPLQQSIRKQTQAACESATLREV